MQELPPSTRRRGAVAVVLREAEFLVIQRSALVVAPGAYCFPGGAIEHGETEAEALVREMREELGADVLPVRRIWHSVTPWGVELAWWRAELAAEARLHPNEAEVASYDWMTAEAMSRLDNLLESNHAFLAALRRGEIRAQ